MDLGPLNRFYREGLNSSMSPLVTIQARLPGLPTFAKNFFFKPVKDTNDISDLNYSVLEGSDSKHRTHSEVNVNSGKDDTRDRSQEGSINYEGDYAEQPYKRTAQI